MKIRKIELIRLLSLIFIANGLYAQEFRLITRLPDVLNETSGLEVTALNEIWSFNDSGGEPKIFQCDTLGNLEQSITISPGDNVDYEDITQDPEGNLYIGDVGNNLNLRMDLKIYKIKPPFDATEEPEVISFSFEDQADFPPSELRFDCESVIWFQNNLYVFTKHRNFPMATNVYKLPDQGGDYVATKLGSFLTGEATLGEHPMYDYWVTAADISPDNNKLALLSNNKVWIITDFENDNFFDGNVEQVNLTLSTQKEGICFRNNFELYITDEYWATFDIGRNLYLLQLDSMKTSHTSENNTDEELIFYPNPFTENIFLNGNLDSEKIYIVNEKGQCVLSVNATKNTINLNGLPKGLYYLVYLDGTKMKKEKILKLE